ncbi:MAG TPA: AraC family transcriptional regulator [Thermoanaerobaculia bacterium]|nr:AraC family transcriptional regulator [Thermoanaerobaculia bacterium]
MQSILDDFLRKNRPSQEDLPREIREVLAHIHVNLFDLELNVRSLKSCCRIRDNNVSSRFRYLMGMTIKQYVEGLRMEAAARLLRNEDVGIFDVSIAVGYNSLQTFYRAFGRHCGCTPAEYRRRLSKVRSFSEDKKGRCAGVDA